MITVKNITPKIVIDWAAKARRYEILEYPELAAAARERAETIGIETRDPVFHKQDTTYPAPMTLQHLLKDYIYKVRPPDPDGLWFIMRVFVDGVEVSSKTQLELIDGNVVEVDVGYSIE